MQTLQQQLVIALGRSVVERAMQSQPHEVVKNVQLDDYSELMLALDGEEVK